MSKSPTPYQHFVKRFFLVFVVCYMGIVAMNYWIDPAYIFVNKPRFYSRLATIAQSGKNIAHLRNCDDRLFQKYYIATLENPKDVIVLGSSRMMTFDSSLFPGYSFYNNSVTAASIEDHIAIYAMYRDKGFVPKIVVLGLDPWLLNKHSGTNGFVSLFPEYQNGLRRMGITDDAKPTQISKAWYVQLFSPSYFKGSIQCLAANVVHRKHFKYYETSNRQENEMVELFDGSVSYDLRERNRSVEEVRSRALSNASNPIGLSNFTQLDSGAKQKFEAFMETLLADGVDIVLVLPPYHPATYPLLASSEKFRLIASAEDYYVEFANDRKIKIVGSFDPRRCQASETDFYDGEHAKLSLGSSILSFDAKRHRYAAAKNKPT